MQKMRTYRSHFRSNLVLNLFFCGFWLFIRALTFSLFLSFKIKLSICNWISSVQLKEFNGFLFCDLLEKRIELEIKHKKYAIEKDEWLKIGDHFVQWMENSVAQVNGHSLSFAVAVDTVLISANNFNQIKHRIFASFQNYSLQSTRNRMEFYRSKEYSHTTHITYGSNCTFNRFFCLYLLISFGSRHEAHKIRTH